MESPLYMQIGITRDELFEKVCKDLETIISDEYSDAIADRIVDEIAYDISVSADIGAWNDSDYRLAFGRVLTDLIGIER